MGVKIRKRRGKWYVFVNYHGRRKAKCVGSSRGTAEQVRRQLELKLANGDVGIFADGDDQDQVPTFGVYADSWLKGYARQECKTSTADCYEGVLRQYLRPRFATTRLDEVKRDDVKAMIEALVADELSRNTIRNAICVIRGIFNHAIEDGILESNPAARLGRFTRTAKTAETKGIALTGKEAQQFLEGTKIVCEDPKYDPEDPKYRIENYPNRVGWEIARWKGSR
jgi:integrase